MGVAKEPRSALGPSIIMAVLLLDVGLIIWGWHLYQRRQERLDDAGLDFARAPEATPAAPTAPAAKEDTMTGIDRYVVKESLSGKGGARPGAPAPAGAAPAPSGAPPGKPALVPAAAAPSAPEMKLKMDKAVGFFFDLKNTPRFKNSRVVQGWTHDFLSYPDLKALNDGWRKEHDPMKFLLGMVQSPNFRAMTAKYLAQADMQAFIKDMATSPTVLASAGGFMSNDTLKGTVSALNLMGGAAPMKDSAAQLGQLKENPSLKKVLDGTDAAPTVR